MRNKRLASLIVCTAVVLTGCSNKYEKEVKNTPLEAQMSIQEAVDYYASTFDYDVVTGSKEENKKYEFHVIEGDLKDKLTNLTLAVNEELSYKSYDELSEYEDNNTIISESLFDYMKGYLNSYVLDSNATVEAITGAVGYYYVDVKYPYTYRNSYGNIKSNIELVGIHGALYRDAYGNDAIDNEFMVAAISSLKDAGYDNIGYDRNNGRLMVANRITSDNLNEIPKEVETEPVTEEDSSEVESESEGTVEGNEESLADTTESSERVSEEESTTVEETTRASVYVGDIGDDYIVADDNGVRRLPFDLREFNDIVGFSSTTMDYMPKTEFVYEFPKNEGYVSGVGMFPTGKLGLNKFGLDTNSVSGTIEIRYVFKDTIDGSGELSLSNMYVISDTANVEFSNTSASTVPSFLETEIDKLVERADRANVDFILSSLLDGTIYSDLGVGLLRGYEYNCSNVLRNMSTVRNILSREVNSNDYLVEIETTRIEGAKSADVYGQYRDKYYLYIEQVGDKFYINDMIRFSREIVDEPQLVLDSAETKRVVSLGLSGEVSDDTKGSVNELLTELYTAGTARLMYGPKEVTLNGEKVTLDKGMYDCFTTNSELLSDTDREYMNAAIRTVLVKMGTNVGSTYKGNVTMWMGGTADQVEVETEELVEYAGMNKGTYMRVYYLVSCINERWTIDERIVIEEVDVEGDELNNIKSRIN